MKKTHTKPVSFYEGVLPSPKFGNKTAGGQTVTRLFVPMFPNEDYPICGYVKGRQSESLFFYGDKDVTVVYYNEEGETSARGHTNLNLQPVTGEFVEVEDLR